MICLKSSSVWRKRHANSNVIKRAGLADSTSAAIRLIQQGAVRVDGEQIQDRNLSLKQKRQLFYKLVSVVLQK